MIKNKESVAMKKKEKKGWDLLVDNLGEADATRFIVSFERGTGDTVQEIKKYWGDKKIEEMHSEILEAKKKGLI